MPESYYSWAAIIVAVLYLDRLLFSRGKVKLIDLHIHEDYKDNYKQFSVKFRASGALTHHHLEYHLRNTEDPTTVIVGKKRTLSFSTKDKNHETLMINKKYIKGGRWELCVKVTSQGSRINPFYVYHPVVSTIKKEFEL